MVGSVVVTDLLQNAHSCMVLLR